MKGSISMGNFPDIPKSISDYLYEEEGNITRNKLLMVGSMAVVMSVLFALDADAGHGSHKSHKSHTSHSSSLRTQTDNGHSSHSSSSHTNSIKQASHSNATHYAHHVSHRSHMSHISGPPSSHISHRNHANASLTQPQNPSQVLVPKRTDSSSLFMTELPKTYQVPEVPNTIAPTFSAAEAIVPPTEKE